MNTTPVIVRATAALTLFMVLVAGLLQPERSGAQDDAFPSEPTAAASADRSTEPSVPATRPPRPAASIAPAESVVPVDAGSTMIASDAPLAEDADANASADTEPGADDSVSALAVAQDAIELRARTEESDDDVDHTVFVVDDGLAPDQLNDSAPFTGGTFQIVSVDDLTIVDQATTGQSGVAYLDIPLDTDFVIVDADTLDQSDILNISEGESQSGRSVVTATRFIAEQNASAVGDVPFAVAVEQVELRARTEETSAGESGQTFFADPSVQTGEVTTQQFNDSTPGAGLLFAIVIVSSGTVVDSGTTDAGGSLLLDAPVDEPFVVQDLETGNQSAEYTLDANDVQAGRLVVSATRTVTVEPGPNVGPNGDILAFPVATDQLSVQARFQQDPAQNGMTTYVEGGALDATDFVDGDAFPAGGVTFTVLTDDGLIVDQATTDASGTVLLDLPVFQEGGTSPQTSYLILNDVDRGLDEFATPSVNDVRAGRDTVTATIYVDDLNDVVPSPSPSEAPSRSGGPSFSAGPSPSLTPPPSVEPSIDPSDAPPASQEPGVSPAASAEESLAPTEPTVDGVTVTVTTAVPLPDGAEVCLDEICQTLDADTVARSTQTISLTKATGRTVVAQAMIPSGTVITFENVPPGDYTLTISLNGELLYAAEVRVVAGETPTIVIDEGDQIDPPIDPSTSDRPGSSGLTSPVVGGSGMASPADAGSDDDRSGSTAGGATTLPSTGTGGAAGGSLTWTLVALLAVIGAVATGWNLCRRVD